MNKKNIVLIISFFVFVCNSYAKRSPRPEVVPLEKDNFIYKTGYISSKNNDYDFGVLFIESKDEVKYIFTVPVYFVKINKLKEYDVQWNFIKSIEFKNDEIITIVNEENKVYEFNINTYEVRAISEKQDYSLYELYEKKIKDNYVSSMIQYKGVQSEKKQLQKINDVIDIAENALFTIYGKDTIRKEMPYKIQKFKNEWYVSGSLPEGYKGRVFEIIINAETSLVESYIHSK